MTATTPYPAHEQTATPPHPPGSVHETPDRTAETPWYRRLWVLIAGAALLVLLSFAGGFAVGSAGSLLGAVTDTQGGPGPLEGGPGQFPGDGQPPQGGPGERGPGMPPGEQGDQSADQPGTADGTNS
ncbi:hypothetical protein BJ978_001323 [Agromyces terreus]|uniref:Uncharacterized protein n=1 Tax=Agromyces terreus TaxID=424795 RepID=A0A9X2KEH9_9MICO|nr:hypothetical protein [Agromyces terreus]MCP2370647.1 hypothetical protein [Agromyces terreus]